MAERVPFSNRPAPGSGHFLRAVHLRKEDVPAWRDYPFRLPAVQALRRAPLALAPDVTIFVGENGTGKSTLLEGIAVAFGFNPEGGSRNFQFRTRDTHSALSECLTLQRGAARPADGFFLRAESFYNVATEIDNLGMSDHALYGGRSLHEQSHGEAFFSLFMHRFGGSGLYLLDEPEAALSPMRQMAMLARMYALAQDGAQFVVATHSPILMAYPGARLLQFDGFGVAPVKLEETEHNFVTREFLNAPERMLRNLLSAADPSRESDG